jgi:elongation factor 1-gamma
VSNHPTLKPIFGETEFCEKPLQFTPPAKPAKEAAKPAPAAAPAAPKESKPKAKKADDDEEEDDIPKEPVAKNPLDSLPKSEFNLEDWKRAYSNMDTRGAGGSVEWFYKKCVSCPSFSLLEGN